MVPPSGATPNDLGTGSTLGEMVPLSEGESNELFQTLSDWEHQLQHLDIYEKPDVGDKIEEPTP